jgi:N-acetylglucosamine-6-phosphate deacetylase
MSSCFRARHYLTGNPTEVAVTGRVISDLTPIRDDSGSLPWIAPGLVDIQINGFAGIDLNRPLTDSDAWETACSGLLRHGCTHFLATIITNQTDVMNDLLSGMVEAYRRHPFNCIGFHMEGPFLNSDPGYRGAHNPDWMRPHALSIFEEWQALSENAVKLVTLAPEASPEHAISFIRCASQSGVRISIGHSGAMGEILDDAIEAGATCWTHLGNAALTPNHKFENVIFHALARNALMASVIPDGHHIPAHALEVICRSLGERLILTTDAMSGAGAPPGRYTLCHLEIEVGKDGVARMPDSINLAGSTLNPFESVFRAAALTGLPWPELWTAMSTRPAAWLGIDHNLEIGREASFCLFNTDPDPSLSDVWLRGEKREG